MRAATRFAGNSTKQRLRIGGSIAVRSLLFALVSFSLTAVAVGQDVALGKRLYQTGIAADGQPVAATLNGDVTLRGALVACAKCHRRSGYGAAEGARLVPPITGPLLFNAQQPRRIDLFRNLFQEDHPVETRAKVLSARSRPAYTPALLERVLTHGIDAAGQSLDALMPRYRLGATDGANLRAYLETLGSAPAAGVDAQTIHFATIIDARVEPARQRALRDVLEMFVHCQNLEVDRYRAHQGSSLHYRDDFIPTYRKWQLHEWRVYGPAATWPRELQRQYDEQPVFAILSGLSDDHWGSVQTFCEQHELPCLFPNTILPDTGLPDTGLPQTARPNRYSLFLHGGLPREAQALASLIKQDIAVRNRVAARSEPVTQPPASHRVVQVYRDAPRGRAAAATLRAELKLGRGSQASQGGVELVDLPLHALGDITADIAGRLRAAQPSVVVVWLDEGDARTLAAADAAEAAPQAVWFYSGHLLGVRRVDFATAARAFLLWPYLIEPTVPRIYRVRRWLNSRGIVADDEPIPSNERTNERTQLNAYFACDVTEHALRHLLDHYSRDYLIQWIEHETENGLNPGVYPSLSLGPDQRFASRSVEPLPLEHSPTFTPRP